MPRNLEDASLGPCRVCAEDDERRSRLKARKAAAVAAFKRRQYEHKCELLLQLEEVEEAELIAELKRIKAEDMGRHHRSISKSRPQKWVYLHTNMALWRFDRLH